jgi:hypothetical protein
MLDFAGITEPHTYSPVMSEQFHVYLTNDMDAERAQQRLAALRVNDRPLMRPHREDGHAVFGGVTVFDAIADDAVVTDGDGKTALFYELFYQSETVKSGMHHPDGALWIRTPRREHHVEDERVPLRAIAPTMVRMLGLDVPAFMTAEPLGIAEPVHV